MIRQGAQRRCVARDNGRRPVLVHRRAPVEQLVRTPRRIALRGSIWKSRPRRNQALSVLPQPRRGSRLLRGDALPAPATVSSASRRSVVTFSSRENRSRRTLEPPSKHASSVSQRPVRVNKHPRLHRTTPGTRSRVTGAPSRHSPRDNLRCPTRAQVLRATERITGLIYSAVTLTGQTPTLPYAGATLTDSRATSRATGGRRGARLLVGS